MIRAIRACIVEICPVARDQTCGGSILSAAQSRWNNKPGALAEVTGKLAKKGINIDSAYATAPKGARKAVLFVSVSQRGA